jgi:hypothetical protein
MEASAGKPQSSISGPGVQTGVKSPETARNS